MLGRVPILENIALAEKASPMTYISKDKDIPPIFIMHGDSDAIVPFNQSVRLYEKLRDCGKEAEFYKLLGGGHGVGGFGGIGAVDLVVEFIKRYID